MTEPEILLRQIRILERKLARSEANRALLEEHKDRSEHFHRRVIGEKEVTEQRLRSSEQKARQASDEKSRFLANMSHEIRSPMNGILGMAQLLKRGEMLPEQAPLAQSLLRSAEALLAVLDDVLDFSKIEAGYLQLEAVEFELGELIEKAVFLFAEPAHRKNLELVCDLDSELHSIVTGDPNRLRQILANLISNAVKFTSHGEIRVAGWTSGVTTIFEVSDTGIGLEAEAVVRVFDPFCQADESTSRRFGGSGLGLSITRELVQLMGGTVTCRSSSGKGSTFRVTLPLRIEREVGPSRPPESFALVDLANESQSLALQKVLSGLACSVLQVRKGESWTDLVDGIAAARTPRPILYFFDETRLEAQGLRANVVHGGAVRRVVVTPLHRPLAALSAELEELTRPFSRAEVAHLLTPESGPTHGPPATADAGSSRAGFRVLVADDEPVNQSVAQAFLTIVGCECEIARDGQEAVEIAKRKRFDLILMDCQMPKMDGLDAARQIRVSSQLNCKTPIVAVTASVMSGDRDRCEAAGMNGFLAKPYSLETLLEEVNRWAGDEQTITAMAR